MTIVEEIYEVREVIIQFFEEICNSERLSSQELERVLSGDKDDLTSADLQQKPERFTEQKLIFPILSALGVQYEAQPHGQTGARHRWPDFGTRDLDAYIIGENKPLNNVEEANEEIPGYLDSISIGADYGIATDGIEWNVFTVERGGDVTEFPLVASFDLRPLLVKIASDNGYIASSTVTEVNEDAELEEFINGLSKPALNELVSVEAPKFLRERRKRSVEEFYDLYIELLFGKGDDYNYDTHLLQDISAPSGATNAEKRRFAVTLMNRLLFIKILERKEVIPEGLLKSRLDTYLDNSDAFMRNFYDSQLSPLFYDLLNTPIESRVPDFKGGWFAEIPYLNGGLFREGVPQESQYTVADRVLTVLIRDLIEGSEIGEGDNGLDPAVLGSVFEMTINFIGGEFGSQEDIGAYYTPDDVTKLVTVQSVDPRIKDILVDAWSSHNDEHTEDVRDYLESLTLSEILEKIEGHSESSLVFDSGQVRIEFGDSELIQEAIDRLSQLRILDPACGSGHFLTTAMEQLNRVQKSLFRGLNPDDELTGVELYETKKRLALNNIYGVDVDPIGIEIARLRVWLKIIEQGWKPEYGRLPNIELNIVPGNSLIGLPIENIEQSTVDTWDDRLTDLVNLRLEYKQDDTIDKSVVLEKRNEIREEANQEFLKRLTYEGSTTVESLSEWESIIDGVSEASIYPKIQTIQVKRRDENDDDIPLTESDIALLDNAGFRTYTNSARLYIERRYEELTPDKATKSKGEIKEEIVSDLNDIISQDGLYFAEVERQPLPHDNNEILGTPFHWIAEFPELAEQTGSGEYKISFDIIIGNPPYGNLLNQSEKLLAQWYHSTDLNEVSLQFIERQLQLLSENGYYGNIISLRFVYQTDAYPVHDYMRELLEDIRIACFSHRPQPIFENATVRSAIVTGKKDTTSTSDVKTSELIFLNDETREKKLFNIEYNSVEGYLLRDRIGSESRDSYEILPKVGPHRDILDKLKKNSVVLNGSNLAV